MHILSTRRCRGLTRPFAASTAHLVNNPPSQLRIRERFHSKLSFDALFALLVLAAAAMREM